MSWSSSLQGQVTSSDSPLESLRFSRDVARIELGMGWRDSFETAEVACAELVSRVEQVDADLTIVRAPSEIVGLAHALGSTGAFPLPAGTLMYWGRNVEGFDFSPTAHGAATWSGGIIPHDELDALLSTVPRVFRGYQNHYSYNPSLPPDAVEAGYHEWASSTIRSASGFVSAIQEGEEFLAIASGRFADAGNKVIEIELAGVVPEARRRGSYSRLIAEVTRFAASRGVDQVVISTQAVNVAVQAAWAKLGFLPSHAIDTFHVAKSAES